jgi:flagellar biosynthesis protein FlhG
MKIFAVASGKGGVGKTTASANLGVALASAGQRVVLVDADLGLANLDVALGIQTDVTLQHVVEGLASFFDAAVAGPAGVRVVAGGSGISRMLRLSRVRLEALLSRLSELRDTTDVVILDVSSGADPRVMTFLKAADEAILITTPDPASIVDCYSTAKVLFRYKKDAVVNIVVNKVSDEKQARCIFESIRSTSTRFLGRTVHYLGFVREDKKAAEISATRKPFVLANPDLSASLDVRSLADVLARDLKRSKESQPSLDDGKAA